MSKALLVVLFITCTLVATLAQQQASSAPIVAFSSVEFVPGVQMTGNATWHYGSDEQTGTATLSAYATGRSTMALELSGRIRSETQGAFADAARACTWSGPDGVAHPAANHNCWLSAVWFLPQITLQPGAGAPDATFLTAAASDGKTMLLHQERHPTARDTRTANLLTEVSGIDMGVDAVTHLPQWLLFKTHPDNDAGTDIQVEIDLSDYRTVNGLTIPFHIQKLINHTLVLDIQIAEVQILASASTP